MPSVRPLRPEVLNPLPVKPKKSCETCRFFCSSGNECRQHAPVCIEGMPNGVFPVIHFPPSSWCGDWQKKEDSDGKP